MKRYPLIVLLFCCLSMHLLAQNFGEFASAAYVKSCGVAGFYNLTGSGANCINTSCGTVFQGTNFGSFFQNSGALVLKGGEIKTWKNGGANVCGGNLMYTLYPTGFRPASPIFSPCNLPFKANCAGSIFADGLGPCGGNDQKWSRVNDSIDLTNLSPGNYTLEIYIEYYGDDFSTSGCGTTRYVSNGGSNYLATFSIVTTSPTCGLVLPTSLLDFNVQCTNELIEVEWTISSDQPYTQYTLEYSTDFQIWNTENTVVANKSQGNEQSYRNSFVAPTQGWCYVRLTAKDENGAKHVLGVRVADCSQLLQCLVLENELQILHLPKETTSVSILDVQGKCLGDHECSKMESMVVDMNSFSAGTYFIVLFSGNKPFATKRFVKL